MFWTDPSIDLTATLEDLELAPLTAWHLQEASLLIEDTGLRALLTTAILSSAPHRIRSDPDQIDTGYHLEGGRALRAAVMSRALMLSEKPADSATSQLLLTSAMLGTLVPAGEAHSIGERCRWLMALTVREREHLAHWGCGRSRARKVLELSILAAHCHIDLGSPRTWSTRPESRMLCAGRATDLARPRAPCVPRDPILLPVWMDPHQSWENAARRLEKDLSSTHSDSMLHPATDRFLPRQ